MQHPIPFHFPFRPVDHWERVRLRIEYPLVERDELIVRKQQEEILEPEWMVTSRQY
jgi:hypothetical protein